MSKRGRSPCSGTRRWASVLLRRTHGVGASWHSTRRECRRRPPVGHSDARHRRSRRAGRIPSDGLPRTWPVAHALRVTKAVIPAAGLGTRFLPATKAQPKEMLPVVDKPAIQYVVEEAVRAGIDDILHHHRPLQADARGPLRPRLRARVPARAARASTTSVDELRRPGRAGRHPLRAPGRAAGPRPRRRRWPAGTSATSPFAVLLGDELMADGGRAARGHDRHPRPHGRSVIALKEVRGRGDLPLRLRRARARSATGWCRFSTWSRSPSRRTPRRTSRSWAATSSPPEIFDDARRVRPASAARSSSPTPWAPCSREQRCSATTFTEGRYDIGQKLDYLRGHRRAGPRPPELGPDFGSSPTWPSAVPRLTAARRIRGRWSATVAAMIPLAEARAARPRRLRAAAGPVRVPLADARRAACTADGRDVARGGPAVRQPRDGRLRGAGRRRRRGQPRRPARLAVVATLAAGQAPDGRSGRARPSAS